MNGNSNRNRLAAICAPDAAAAPAVPYAAFWLRVCR